MYESGKAERQSGVVGVNWDAHQKRWAVSISIYSKYLKLGNFSNLDNAITARKNAEIIKEEILSKPRSKPKSSVYQEFKERVRNQKIIDANNKNAGVVQMQNKKRPNYGVIKEMDRDKKLGFIESEDNIKLYFTSEETGGNYNNLKVGDEVIFVKKNGFQFPTADQIRKVQKPVQKVISPLERFRKQQAEIEKQYGLTPASEDDPLLWKPDNILPYGFPYITKIEDSYFVAYEEEHNGVNIKFPTIPESFGDLNEAQRELRILCHYLNKDKNRDGYKQAKIAQYIEESKKRYSISLYD